MEKIKFEGKLQPIGNAKNPSFYIKVDKKLVTSQQLDINKRYSVELIDIGAIEPKEVKEDDTQTKEQDESEAV